MTDFNAIISQSDHLFQECKFEEACYLLRQYVQPPEYEILWRLARVIYSLHKEWLSRQKKRAEALILEGFEIATKLLQLAPNASPSHKYYAIFLGEKAWLEGTKQQILILGKMLTHILAAKQLDPTDPFVLHLEGSFYEKLACLQWFEKKFVYAMVKDLVQPTHEDALLCLLRAEEIRPNFLSLNQYLIGKIYFEQKEYNEARSYLTRMANLEPVRTEDDRCAKESARNLLMKM